MKALRKIEDDLRRLSAQAEEEGFEVDPLDLRVLADRVGAQAEMIEKGIAE